MRVAHAAGPSVVAFSASTYNVQEDMTFRTITVLRTGDISGPATVDYATANVSASQRSDYTSALGTLRFGANESSKSFDVLIGKTSTRARDITTLSPMEPGRLAGSPSTRHRNTDEKLGWTKPDRLHDIFVDSITDFLASQQTTWQLFGKSISSCGTNDA